MAKTPKKIKKTVNFNSLTGNDLLQYRTQMGFNVAEFAKALGVAPASIYRWEKSLDVLKLQISSKEALTRLL